jgi:hypothetical protein
MCNVNGYLVSDDLPIPHVAVLAIPVVSCHRSNFMWVRCRVSVGYSVCVLSATCCPLQYVAALSAAPCPLHASTHLIYCTFTLSVACGRSYLFLPMYFLDVGLAFNLRSLEPSDGGYIVLFLVKRPPPLPIPIPIPIPPIPII